VRAQRAAEALVAAGADSLLVWGFAGALVTGIEAGSLALPDELVSQHGVVWRMDSSWHQAWRRRLCPPATANEPVTGRMVTVPSIAGSLVARQGLAALTGATTVDMEGSAVAEVARRAGLPCLTVRSILDTPSRPWPSALDEVGDGTGWQASLVFSALVKAREWPRWLALAVALRRAERALRAAARCLAAEAAA
jgi:adenosylhomocysteine nucleosidase